MKTILNHNYAACLFFRQVVERHRLNPVERAKGGTTHLSTDKQVLCLCSLRLWACLFLFMATSLLLAEVSSAGQLTPGTLERQFEKPPTPRSSEKSILPTPSLQETPEVDDEYRFILRQLIVEGGTVYSSAELVAYYGELIGQEISVAALFTIANGITARYAHDGYALSLAYVPAQEIGGEGSVRLVIIEGYINEVSYQGKVEDLSDRAKRQLDLIMVERPLTVATLERQLLLANDLPGITFVTTVDRSSVDVGGARLVVELLAQDLDYSLGINNRGSRAQGPWRANFGLNINNVLLDDSVFGLHGQVARHVDEMQFYVLDYGLILADNGLRLNLQASMSKSEPDVDILQALDYDTRSESYNIALLLPVIRSRRKNLDGLLRLDIKQSESAFFGETNSDEKTRVLRLGATYDWIDTTGSTTLIQATLSQGLDILGATDNNSSLKVRDAADYHFTALRLDVSRDQWLTNRTTLVISMTGQYGSDPLAPSEQIGWGGEYAGRAYDSFELSGDHGLLAGLELRQTYPSPMAGINYVQPYVYVEGAKLWTERNSGLGGGTNHVDEYDYGVGLRGQALDKHYFFLELAQPGDKDVAQEGNRDLRIFAGWQMVY